MMEKCFQGFINWSCFQSVEFVFYAALPNNLFIETGALFWPEYPNRLNSHHNFERGTTFPNRTREQLQFCLKYFSNLLVIFK